VTEKKNSSKEGRTSATGLARVKFRKEQQRAARGEHFSKRKKKKKKLTNEKRDRGKPLVQQSKGNGQNFIIP